MERHPSRKRFLDWLYLSESILVEDLRILGLIYMVGVPSRRRMKKRLERLT